MALERISNHRVFVTERGGRRRIGELKNLSLVRWNRKRDDISDAVIRMPTPKIGSAQANLINSIETNRHELCIYRNGVRSWEGPIHLPQFSRSTIEISAEDVMRYVHGLVMQNAYDSSYPAFASGEKVVARSLRILQGELARREAENPPVNVLAHVVAHQASTDAETTRKTLKWQYTAFEQIDDMARRSGMDYTVVGRAIHMWDTSRNVMGQTHTATEVDFLGELYTSNYGKEGATISRVTDGRGNVGSAVSPAASRAYYGHWERLDTVYDENDEDAEIPSIAEMTSQAKRNLNGRNPPPMLIRVPDNSTLNPEGILKVEDLVPGVYIPVRAQLGIRQVSQMQKLHQITVEETPKGETVKVTLLPATAADEQEEEE